MAERWLFNTKVPMRDGVKLSANIVFPEEPGRYPVLMNRTPYVKDSAAKSTIRIIAKTLADRGYVIVFIDVRGRGESEGVFNPLFQEIEDGYDCFEWAGTQEWSNGRIGTFGGSYEGWVQVFPMRLQSKYHKAAFLMCTPSLHPFHDSGAYTSGVPMPIMKMWRFVVSGRVLKEVVYDKNYDWESVLNVRPLKDTLVRMGLAEPLLDDVAYQHETYDGFYKKLWEDEMINQINVPSYFVSGWFDDSLKGSIEHFPQLTKSHPNHELRKRHKLLIGPWPHQLSIETSKLGVFDYGPDSIVPLYGEALRWFDFWLKDIDTGVLSEPQVRLFLMGDNRWITANSYPVSEAKELSLYLASDGPSNGVYGQGKLSHAHGSQKASSFTYNPDKPAPTPFWKEHFQNGTNEDLRPIQRRDDVLVFTSDPLEQPLNIVGPIGAELFVSTSARDTDFVARLSDVAPDGYAERLNHGIFRLRYHEGYDKISLVRPGEILKIKVDMWATGQRFEKGHCIRLDVTSSAYPTWAPNLNTGENVWLETKAIIAQQTVHHSPSHPSKLTLWELENPKFDRSWRDDRWSGRYAVAQ